MTSFPLAAPSGETHLELCAGRKSATQRHRLVVPCDLGQAVCFTPRVTL